MARQRYSQSPRVVTVGNECYILTKEYHEKDDELNESNPILYSQIKKGEIAIRVPGGSAVSKLVEKIMKGLSVSEIFSGKKFKRIQYPEQPRVIDDMGDKISRTPQEIPTPEPQPKPGFPRLGRKSKLEE
jgi:hypothetical protein